MWYKSALENATSEAEREKIKKYLIEKEAERKSLIQVNEVQGSQFNPDFNIFV